MIVENRFGTGELFDDSALVGKTFVSSTACLSITSEFNSWSNANKDKITNNIHEANNIVLLGCQVTDLAVLNDLKYLYLNMIYSQVCNIYVGGCLSRRFDIPLPEGVRRLDRIVSDYTYQDEMLVKWEAPFWINNFKEKNESSNEQGYLFRNYYPLRSSVGCRCKYCTIKTTRGEPYRLDIDRLEQEFVSHENVVVISDSPSVEEIRTWCRKALKHNKKISFRNVEPTVAIEASEYIFKLSIKGLLDIFHCPIQSNNIKVLNDMDRNTIDTLAFIQAMIPRLSADGVFCATNIIIDYKDYPNPEGLKEYFDYVSWNPYWDGTWDEDKAIERMKKYLPFYL